MKNNNYLSQLNKTIRSRNNLRNMHQAKQMMNVGLYEEASKLQEPITKAISETSKDTKNELEKVRKAIENQALAALPAQSQQPSQPLIEDPDDIEILNTINNESVTSSRPTNNTLTYIKTINNVKAYSIWSNQNNKQLFGLKNTTLVDLSSNNEYQIPSVGVAKLLFQSRQYYQRRC